MRTFPLTSIEHYASELDTLHRAPRAKNYTWAYTLYGAGRQKWVPYTQRALKVLTENVMGALGMASRNAQGVADIRPGYRAVYNVPPRPYLAGIVAFELRRQFGLEGVIKPGLAEFMEFEERIREELNAALAGGVDIFVSMTSVLKRISDRFADGLSSGESSSGSKSFRAAARYVTALSKAKLARRNLRPHDLWKPKAILGWGIDTRHFRDQLGSDWGRPPFEMYASTEAGCMGLQYGADKGVALNPNACFFEFLPEAEIDAVRNDPKYTPQTALLPDVGTNGRYEVVITSFYGMPFLRYRTGHMVRFSPGQLGYGPDLEHVGRADDRLDIGGFTRIDEGTIWRAVAGSGVALSDWIVRRETQDDRLVLSMYAEPTRDAGPEQLTEALHAALVKSDPLYADVEAMLGWQPLQVTVLSPGTFNTYYNDMRKAGEELLARKPQRVNAPDATVEHLMGISRRLSERRAA